MAARSRSHLGGYLETRLAGLARATSAPRVDRCVPCTKIVLAHRSMANQRGGWLSSWTVAHKRSAERDESPTTRPQCGHFFPLALIQ